MPQWQRFTHKEVNLMPFHVCDRFLVVCFVVVGVLLCCRAFAKTMSYVKRFGGLGGTVKMTAVHELRE